MIGAALLAAVVIARPNPNVTWGETRRMSRRTMCSTPWGRDVRHVTVGMRREVFSLYGIPYSQRANYELDHLIPRSLGGADDVRNLWPQPLWQARHMKDVLEVKLGKMVCAGEITAEAAQQMITSDWYAAYRLYVGGGQ